MLWDWDNDEILSPGTTKPEMREFRAKVRKFVDAHIIPFVADWDLAGHIPLGFTETALKADMYSPLLSLPEEDRVYYDFIWQDEMARCGTSGLIMCGFISIQLGFPPVLAAGLAGGKELLDTFAARVAAGQTKVAFAVTEPYGGSDVAALRTRATRNGQDYIINGEKAFITGALSSDYITVAAREENGLTLFLVDAKSPGVSIERVPTQGWCVSETCRIVLSDVHVPWSHKVGESGKAFKYIMHNFNHERLIGCFGATRLARVCLEDAVAYAKVRKTFGKPLIEHQVIRHKIAEMARIVLANHAMNMTLLKAFANGAASKSLATLIASGKVNATKNLEFVAREASQVLGGKSFLRGSGPGGRIERIYREVRVLAIGGGSEEILTEFVSRMC